jgi:hypothetical protein
VLAASDEGTRGGGLNAAGRENRGARRTLPEMTNTGLGVIAERPWKPCAALRAIVIEASRPLTPANEAIRCWPQAR